MPSEYNPPIFSLIQADYPKSSLPAKLLYPTGIAMACDWGEADADPGPQMVIFGGFLDLRRCHHLESMQVAITSVQCPSAQGLL